MAALAAESSPPPVPHRLSGDAAIPNFRVTRVLGGPRAPNIARAQLCGSSGRPGFGQDDSTDCAVEDNTQLPDVRGRDESAEIRRRDARSGVGPLFSDGGPRISEAWMGVLMFA